MQRTSVDVDFIAPSKTSTDIEKIMQAVGNRLTALPDFQEQVYSPKKPVMQLPMQTRTITLPSVFGQMGKKTSQIKLDFLFTDFKPVVQLVPKTEPVALEVKNVKTVSFGTLVGDKLCTIAIGTIGIKKEEDLPKHLYDLETLVFGIDKTTPESLSEAYESMKQIISFESKIRGKKYSFNEVIESIKTTMTKYSQIDLNELNEEVKPARENLEYFQQLYLPEKQRKPFYAWSTKALKIKYLAELMKNIHDNYPHQKAFEKLVETKNWERKSQTLEGQELDSTKKELLETLKTITPLTRGLKELREKPVARIYWQTKSR